ncbi:hypothetical protein KC675_02895 [Candidatus Dojkabacteria bacterium]|jgi:hypothetical protein|uniref:Uncharacterized protein n=1 Tax=Candidatus Dojkabacteria bacterium TaxID=2099670 RepID=A0A955L173_9BACT|nr:hypothetical protein [Candidatus Dojkabacteria bacterium]
MDILQITFPLDGMAKSDLVVIPAGTTGRRIENGLASPDRTTLDDTLYVVGRILTDRNVLVHGVFGYRHMPYDYLVEGETPVTKLNPYKQLSSGL